MHTDVLPQGEVGKLRKKVRLMWGKTEPIPTPPAADTSMGVRFNLYNAPQSDVMQMVTKTQEEPRRDVRSVRETIEAVIGFQRQIEAYVREVDIASAKHINAD